MLAQKVASPSVRRSVAGNSKRIKASLVPTLYGKVGQDGVSEVGGSTLLEPQTLEEIIARKRDYADLDVVAF